MTAEATRCVGSSARVDAVVADLDETLTRIDPQFARSVATSRQDCNGSSSLTQEGSPSAYEPAP
jgi:hypothetical protein